MPVTVAYCPDQLGPEEINSLELSPLWFDNCTPGMVQELPKVFSGGGRSSSAAGGSARGPGNGCCCVGSTLGCGAIAGSLPGSAAGPTAGPTADPLVSCTALGLKGPRDTGAGA
jgi:hypothetical protein